MTDKHVLLALDDLLNDERRNRIVTIPEDVYDGALEQRGFHRVGEVEGISPLDFLRHEYWKQDLLEIMPLGTITEQDAGLSDEVSELLREVMQRDRESTKSIMPELVRLISGAQVVAGDLYLLRFSFDGPHPLDYEGKNASEVLIVKPKEGAPLIVNAINEQRTDRALAPMVAIPEHTAVFPFFYMTYEGERGYTMNREYGGKLSLTKVGHIEVPRLNLLPFESVSPSGSRFTNPPSLILRGKEFVDYHRSLKS